MVQGSRQLLESGEEFEEAAGFVAEERGWKRWREVEQVILKIIPTEKSSWGLEAWTFLSHPLRFVVFPGAETW
ncbi:MAG: hypothetical protein ACE5KH_06055 [Candidatus Geothermarchaeales archaeon]